MEYDVVVVGAGGSGLRAVMGCASSNLKTAKALASFWSRTQSISKTFYQRWSTFQQFTHELPELVNFYLLVNFQQ